MPVIAGPSEQRIVLKDIRWETYERLLKDLEQCSVPRLTFDQGVLEIMSPFSDHEETKATHSQRGSGTLARRGPVPTSNNQLRSTSVESFDHYRAARSCSLNEATAWLKQLRKRFRDMKKGVS